MSLQVIFKNQAEFHDRSVSDYLAHKKMAYTIEEAADLLSLSRTHLYRLINCGELDSIRIGKSRRVTAKQLDQFIKIQEGRSTINVDQKSVSGRPYSGF